MNDISKVGPQWNFQWITIGCKIPGEQEGARLKSNASQHRESTDDS